MPVRAADFTSMDPHFFDLPPNHALTTIDMREREQLYHQAIRIGFQRDLAVIPIHH